MTSLGEMAQVADCAGSFGLTLPAASTGGVNLRRRGPAAGRRGVVVGTKRRSKTAWGLLPQLVDASVLTLFWGLVLVVANITETHVRSDNRSLALTVAAVVSTLALFHHLDLYTFSPALPRTEEIARVLYGVLSGAAVLVTSTAFLDWRIGAWEVVFGTPMVFAGLILARGLVRNLGELLPGHHEPARVVVVGTGEEARELVDMILDHRECHMELIGVIGHMPVAERTGLGDLWIGPTERMVELMHLHEASGAIVTPTGFRGPQFRSITGSLFKAGFDVHLSTGVIRMWEGRFEVRSLAHEPLVVLETQSRSRLQHIMKRVLDVIGASIAIVVFSPLMALAALAIKLEDRGPVLFRQQRAGRGAEFFGMLKFRSMVTNAEELKAELEAENERSGPLFKLTRDPRVTRVGHIIRELSIDELPQLFNVLKGDMSLVGPRPALIEEEAAFDDEFRSRFDVRPGITGLWQVEARSNASFSAYRRLDLHYVENWTFGFDIRILMATVEQVIVTAAMLPVKRVLRSRLSPAPDKVDKIDVIDLRDRTTARLAAAQVEANGSTPESEEKPTPAPVHHRPNDRIGN